jgi:hypothetical protein
MAIDTASKRRAVVSVGRNWIAPGATPEALKGVSWRQTAGHGWRGIEPASPSPFSPSPGRTYIARTVRARTSTPVACIQANLSASPPLSLAVLEITDLDAMSIPVADTLPITSSSISGVRYAMVGAYRTRTYTPKAILPRTSVGT